MLELLDLWLGGSEGIIWDISLKEEFLGIVESMVGVMLEKGVCLSSANALFYKMGGGLIIERAIFIGFFEFYSICCCGAKSSKDLRSFVNSFHLSIFAV